MASRYLVGALAVATKRPCTEASLALELGLAMSDARSVSMALTAWDLIDAHGHVTAVGRAELAAHKRGRRTTTAEVRESDDIYYPEQLR
jgi:hypothetical protein